jgi:Arc/MetJ-type ribon-helix-helix transcriptional regulator
MKKKVGISITIDNDLLEWLEKMVQNKEFGSVSHGIEKSVTKLKQEYDKKE